jgi:CDP-diacylglycerol--glycerol-3-phosphate 3-phosphatidyltransferase
VLDVVDGYIARKFKIETAFGKILDPIADKIQTLPPFIFFALFGLYSIWWVVPIVIREVAISLIRFKMASQGVVLASERSGKIKTLSQHIAIVASYLFYLGYTPAFEVGVGNHFWYVLRFDAYFFLAAAVVLTVFSGLSFLKNNYMVIFSRA